MLDAKTGEPITTGGLRHGFRCAVAAMPGDSRWWTPEGLAVVEPGYVGCDIAHLPLNERISGERRNPADVRRIR